MPRSIRWVAAAIAVMFLVGACGGISLGDLDQFAINYKVSVINKAVGGAASVTIQIQDKLRSATLNPGESLEVVSLKGGVWHLTVLGVQQRKDALRSVYAGLVKELDAMAPDTLTREVVVNQVNSVEKGLNTVTGTSGSATCAGKVTDPGGAVVNLGVAINFNIGGSQAGDWYCFPT